MDKLSLGKGFNLRKLYNILTSEERELYEKIIDDIGKNSNFYTTSSPEEITDHLINNCGFNKEEIYKLFKKVDSINRGEA